MRSLAATDGCLDEPKSSTIPPSGPRHHLYGNPRSDCHTIHTRYLSHMPASQIHRTVTRSEHQHFARGYTCFKCPGRPKKGRTKTYLYRLWKTVLEAECPPDP